MIGFIVVVFMLRYLIPSLGIRYLGVNTFGREKFSTFGREKFASVRNILRICFCEKHFEN